MGYNTGYHGILTINRELTGEEVLFLFNNVLGKDFREHKEFSKYLPKNTCLTYIDLSLKKGEGYKLMHLIWNGAEKSHDMVDAINLILDIMNEKFGNFKLSGGFICQGEEPEDISEIVFDENEKAIERKIQPPGILIKCPECGHKFTVSV